MSWWINTLFPTIVDVFGSRAWERDPAKASEIIREAGRTEEADCVAKLTPEKWRYATNFKQRSGRTP
jgi:hypothetical protein